MKIKALIDHVGHTIVGELVEENDNQIVLRSPAILIAQPNQSNQLQVQLFPVIFKEFLTGDSKKDGAKFIYNKSRIVDTVLELDDKLTQQYKMMFLQDTPAPTGEGSSETEVIKLFDE
jgi:hypothetical protein